MIHYTHMGDIYHKKFDGLNLIDDFFESFRAEYLDFETRFRLLNWEDVYVLYEEWHIIGLTYFYLEDGPVEDVKITLHEGNGLSLTEGDSFASACPFFRDGRLWGEQLLRVEMFKLEDRAMVQKEQFVKLLLDYAVEHRCPLIHISFYPHEKEHISLFEQYGFYQAGKKGEKLVLVKDMTRVRGDIYQDFPLIHLKNHRKYLLAIREEAYLKAFTEYPWTMGNPELRLFVPYKNSIHKVIVCDLPGVKDLCLGDVILVTKQIERRSGMEIAYVAAGIGVVVEYREQKEFEDFEAYKKYACQCNWLDDQYLQRVYNRGGSKLVKILYNVILRQPMVKQELISKAKVKQNVYWNFIPLENSHIRKVADYGKVGHIIFEE